MLATVCNRFLHLFLRTPKTKKAYNHNLKWIGFNNYAINYTIQKLWALVILGGIEYVDISFMR